MARNTTYPSDPAASDFPSQSAPVSPASPFRREPSNRVSHTAAHRSSASRHNAEILDFERLSSSRRGTHSAAQAGTPQTDMRSASGRPSAHAAARSVRPSVSVGRSTMHSTARREAAASCREGRQRTPSHAAGSPARQEESAPTFFSELKRSLRHRKADREFESHVPASAEADAVERASAPRAGVYKGEMGRSQRKSARMQAEASSGSKERFALPFHISLDSLRHSRPVCISALVCACLILACAFVYPSAKDAYTAIRNQDQAQAEYEAVLARNDEIQNRINLLKTDEGMEDLARSEYGYVFSNENAVKVIGLGSKSIAADAENQTAAVASGSVSAPDTWYSPFLDKFFGYTNGASSSSS